MRLDRVEILRNPSKTGHFPQAARRKRTTVWFAVYAPRTYIDVAMDGPRDRNISGAFALMISDDIVPLVHRGRRKLDPPPQRWRCSLPPGLSIRMLAIPGWAFHMLELFAWWIDW